MKYCYNIKNLDCANCAKKIEDTLNEDKKIDNAIVNFATSKVTITTKINNPFAYVKQIISTVEPEAILSEEDIVIETKNYSLLRLIIGLLISLIAIYFNSIIFIIIGYVLICLNTFKKAWILLVKSKTINENFLVLLSAFGALILQETLEGMMVIALYEIGKILEEKAINKSRKMVSGLLSINEEYANLKKGNKFAKVLTKSLKINDIILVKEGEKVPTDGTVAKGSCSLDTSALTGESKKRQVTINDKVLSGSINTHGLIEVKVDVLYENSTVNKILNLVEKATDKKAKTETIVSKYSKHYTIIVVLLSILVAILLPLFTTLSYNESIYRALTFLVISCPCAIAISIPLSYFSSIGFASSRNILIKGSNYLDALRLIDEIVFDKTGTLTLGVEVGNIKSLNKKYKEKDILKLLALGESFSNHPIAKAIINKVDFELNTKDVKNYKELSGQGISYNLNKDKIKIGSYKFVGLKEMDELIYVSYNGDIIGSLELISKAKDNAKEVIDSLHKLNIKTRIYSGDNKKIALEIGNKLNIEKVEYEMLPNDKYQNLSNLIKSKEPNKLVAFVGDGINDAPVLMLSDIGISMGAIGSDSAIEASDVVIMNDDLSKIPEAINISKRTNKIIIQNLVFALGIKLAVLILSVFGIANMWQAVFADVGVTVLCIINTLRLLKK